MPAIGIGIGIPFGNKRDPSLALDLSFASPDSLPSIFAGQERTGLGGMWDGDLGFGPHNVLLRSNTLDNVAWTPTQGVIAPHIDTPSVTASGWTLTDNNAGGTGAVVVTQSIAVVSGVRQTFSVYAKADQLGFLRLSTLSFDAGANQSSYFNLSTGVVVSFGHSAAGIADDGNGWYRCWVQFTTTTDVSGLVAIYLSQNGTTATVDLDGTSSIRIAAAGLVNGDLQDYIPTTTAARYLMRQEIHPAISPAVRGVLGEPQATNLLWASRDVTNAVWTKGSTATLARDAVGIDGASNTAVTVVDSGATGTGQVTVTQTVTITATNHVLSVYAKADQLSWIALQTGGFDTTQTSYFDLSTASLGATVGHSSAWVEDDGEFVRCSVLFSSTTDLVGYVRVFLADGNGDTTVDLDGTSSVIVDNIDVIAGSYPTSAIFTPTGATAARTTDPRLTYTLPAALQTALATAGTLLVEFAFVGAGSAANASNRVIANLFADSSNYIAIYNLSGNVGVFSRSTATNPIFTTSNGAPVNAYGLVRVALSWSGTATRLTVNGTSYGSGSSFTWPTFTTLSILGGWASANATAGAIVPRGKVYTRFMADAEREALAHA